MTRMQDSCCILISYYISLVSFKLLQFHIILCAHLITLCKKQLCASIATTIDYMTENVLKLRGISYSTLYYPLLDISLFLSLSSIFSLLFPTAASYFSVHCHFILQSFGLWQLFCFLWDHHVEHSLKIFDQIKTPIPFEKWIRIFSTRTYFSDVDGLRNIVTKWPASHLIPAAIAPSNVTYL